VADTTALHLEESVRSDHDLFRGHLQSILTCEHHRRCIRHAGGV
jgi:hypothetical protein